MEEEEAYKICRWRREEEKKSGRDGRGMLQRNEKRGRLKIQIQRETLVKNQAKAKVFEGCLRSGAKVTELK